MFVPRIIVAFRVNINYDASFLNECLNNSFVHHLFVNHRRPCIDSFSCSYVFCNNTRLEKKKYAVHANTPLVLVCVCVCVYIHAYVI